MNKVVAAAALLPCVLGCTTVQGEDRPPRASDRYEQCDSEPGQAALEAARTSIAGGDWAAALPHLRAALQQCPDHVRTHLLYFEAAQSAGADDPRHLDEVRRFYAENDDGASPVWPYMQARLADHNYAREKLLNAALERDVSFYWAYLSWARVMRDLRRAPRALNALDNALAARPGFAEARVERAEVLVELGRYSEARAEYETYMRLRPEDHSVQRPYVRLLVYDLESVGPAEAMVESMLEDDPGDVDALMSKAAIDWRLYRHEQAVEGYRKVLELDPTQARAVLNLGNLYYDATWQGADEETRLREWGRARMAYLYYLGMNRTDDKFDAWDFLFAVPQRLREIDKELGPYDGPAPTLADL